MVTDGDILRQFIDNQRKTKKEIAEDLGISRRQLYQYFDSVRINKENRQRFSEYFQFDIFEAAEPYNEIQKPDDQKTDYINIRRGIKSVDKVQTIPFLPIKAQAGYLRTYDHVQYLGELEHYGIPPGIDIRGADWCYIEVEGDSMLPALKECDTVMCSLLPKFDWENVKNYYAYVIVTEQTMMIKRIYVKSPEEWVLISENEELYPQQLFKVKDLKELWVIRHSFIAGLKPSKMFEIKI
ncbi:LexA family transcriptional regulator [Polluticaenibacter yanchengensis]|uniref:LexA family transcriptional regulator n=1 Tax=Polluticaenibacter yanchengensis TaxID=3014562 RepID=A0ABT4UKC6_9BACT|nr:LexA family transcriptional regulator [Chitinophagaceae bacterium LY-5]